MLNTVLFTFFFSPRLSRARVKVISNMLAAVHLVAVGEAFMLGKKAGIELPQLFDALKVRERERKGEEKVGLEKGVQRGRVERTENQIDLRARMSGAKSCPRIAA